jgi:hypothetical protein
MCPDSQCIAGVPVHDGGGCSPVAATAAAAARAFSGPVVGRPAFEAPAAAFATATAPSFAVAASVAASVAAPVVTAPLGRLLGGLALLAAGGFVIESLRREELLLPRRELEPGAAVAARQLLVGI